MESYSNYNLDDILVRTFMMPAVMPKDKINMINMPNNTYSPNQNNNTINNFKFLTPEEGFLRGNMIKDEYEPYRNMTYLKPNITSEKQMMLYDIQKVSFAAHDLNLYLDTHPFDTNYINLYNEYNKEAKRLTNLYEQKYGPIDLSDDVGLSMTPWSWINEPWPWNK